MTEKTQEVSLVRLSEPHRGRRWRWDVTQYRMVEGTSPGVLDARWHIGGDFGYSRTMLMAAVNIIRSVRKWGQ